MARSADIWHTFLSVEAFTEASARVVELTLAAGRSGNDIERPVHWFGTPSAEAYRAAGASTFITEIAPDATTGYDFSTLEEMLDTICCSSLSSSDGTAATRRRKSMCATLPPVAPQEEGPACPR